MFAGLLTIGQGIFALGGFVSGSTGYIVCLVGRAIFGLGGESLVVLQSATVSRWFMGKELSLALAVNLTFS